jgi:hypothetical protein
MIKFFKNNSQMFLEENRLRMHPINTFGDIVYKLSGSIPLFQSNNLNEGRKVNIKEIANLI